MLTAHASSLFLLSYKSLILNQSVCVFSLTYFLNEPSKRFGQPVFQLFPSTVLFAGALDKQRQMYEEKIEELRNQMVPVGRQAMERTSSIGSFSSGYGSSRMSWCEDRLVTA